MLNYFRCTLILLTIPSFIFGASIKGRVIDAGTGEPVINANIMVEKMNTGAASDLEGYFHINSLNSGSYTLFVSHIAYDTKRIPVSTDNAGDLLISMHETFFQLNEVVVTGTRTEKIHQNVPVTTEVISNKDIESSGALDLGELLNQRAGVAVTSSVEGGAVVSLLGMDSRYILILVDGQPVTGKFNNRVSLDQIATSTIDKIEIIKGPNSSLYGSEAMGGVINIITKKGKSGITASLRTRYSGAYFTPDSVDFGTRNIKLNLGYGNDIFNIRFFYDTTKAVPHNDAPHIKVDGFDKGTMEIDLAVQPWKWVNVHGKLSRFANLEKSHSNETETETRINRLNLLSEVSIISPSSNLELNAVTRSVTYDRIYDQKLINWPIFLGSDTTVAEEVELELNGVLKLPKSTLNIGVESGQSVYEGKRLEAGRQTMKTSSIYGQIEHEITLDKYMLPGSVTLVFGTRYDDDESESVFSPRLAAMYTLNRWKFRAATGQGYRRPSFMERYIDWYHSSYGYSVIGNPDLKPERSIGANLGTEYYHTGSYQVSLMSYYTVFYDMIDDYARAPGELTYTNISKTRFMGIEFQNRWKISNQLAASWGYNFVDNRNQENNQLIPNTQPHNANVKITYQSKNGLLSTSIKTKLVGPYYPEEYNTVVEDFVRSDKKRKTYGIIDFDFKYKLFKHYKITAGFLNLADYTHTQFGPYIGRRFYAELAMEI